jgi:3-phenylpropionate/trans-cinnamate dioxygenase ferredoxin subunit
MDEVEPVLQTPELGPGEIREVHVHGRTLVLLNVGQTYYALDAYCPDEGTNLARDGVLRGELLVCPKDGAAYEIRTGRRAAPGAGPGLRRYAIRVAENAILVGPRLTDARDAA